MNTPQSHHFHPQSSLRERAQTLIQVKGVGFNMAKDASVALRVLFDLASSPDTAVDAITLLHELQVHQVELDLQNEELQSSRMDLESASERQLQLLEASPSAQLVLDNQHHVLECNAHAMACLKQTLPTCSGQALTKWLTPEQSPQVQAWLTHAQHSPDALSMQVVLRVAGQADRAVCASARSNPLESGVLLAWVDMPAVSVPSAT
ncbi:MAG: PAS domain-containing protein [Hydrogenophaga sp.]